MTGSLHTRGLGRRKGREKERRGRRIGEREG
jgi:hypothetical protein